LPNSDNLIPSNIRLLRKLAGLPPLKKDEKPCIGLCELIRRGKAKADPKLDKVDRFSLRQFYFLFLSSWRRSRGRGRAAQDCASSTGEMGCRKTRNWKNSKRSNLLKIH
jgi:hypothetical protein